MNKATSDNRRRALPLILGAIFVDLVSFSILVPVVPQLVANPDSSYYLLPPYIPVEYGYIMLGFLIALFPMIQFFATPILGQLSDIFGRRRILGLSLLGTSLSLAVFGVGVVTGSLMLLFVSRVVGGVMGGGVAVAQAAIADITEPHERIKYFGMIGAANGFGFIIGPVMGAILSDSSILPWFGASTPFWFATGMSFANTCLLYYFMRETKADIPKSDIVKDIMSGAAGEAIRSTINWTSSLKHIVQAYAMKSVRGVLATNFFFQAGVTFMGTFFSVYLIDKFGMDQTGIGYYIGYMGVCIVITQALVLRFVSKRWSEATILKVTLFLGALTIFGYYIPTGVSGLLIVGACVALTNGLSMATLPSLVSRRASPEIQGEVLGINASVHASAQAIPPILAGFLAAEIAPVAPVYISGAIIATAWIVFMIWGRKA